MKCHNCRKPVIGEGAILVMDNAKRDKFFCCKKCMMTWAEANNVYVTKVDYFGHIPGDKR